MTFKYAVHSRSHPRTLAQRAGRTAGAASHTALIWLLLALVVVPALGRMHQILHAAGPEPLHVAPVAHVLTSAPHAHAEGPPSATMPWNLGTPKHHAEDCLLLDQLALADALTVADLPWQAPCPSLGVPLGICLGRSVAHVALFQARAPPAA